MTPITRTKTFVDWVCDIASLRANRVAYTFLDASLDPAERITYAELDKRARQIAAYLQQDGACVGKRALLLYPPGLEYIAGFLGCLYAGVIAVPAYPPISTRRPASFVRIEGIVSDCQPAFALGTAAVAANASDFSEKVPAMRAMKWVETDRLEEGFADQWKVPLIRPESLAFLQYTSGSTGYPKGVMISHANLLANERMIAQGFAHDETTVVAGWLPLYHDMGLIGNVLQPLYLGAQAYLMAPLTFLREPLSWLKAISRYRATTSGAPNFAYGLCASRFRDDEILQLNLESWKVAFNGAEPVRAAALDAFCQCFGRFGFRRTAFYPCYGLAECTLIATGGSAGRVPVVTRFDSRALEQRLATTATNLSPTRELVGCGAPLPGLALAIVDPATAEPCPDGKIGEVWLAGASVSEGYWGRESLTDEVFRGCLAGRSGRWLRTGDLGTQLNGEVYLTGRVKDLIIVRGRNIHPEDIETTVERSHPALTAQAGAAFSIEELHEECVVIIQEINRAWRQWRLEDISARIRQVVSEEFQIDVHTIVLVKPGTVSRTSSGKIQRGVCRDRFTRNELEPLSLDVHASNRVPHDTVVSSASPAYSEARTPAHKEAWVASQTAAVLQVPESRLDPAVPLTAYGLDSLKAIRLAQNLEKGAGIKVDMSQLLDGATIRMLCSEAYHSSSPATVADALLSESLPNTIDVDDWGACSVEQERLWVLQESDPNRGNAYNIVFGARVKGMVAHEVLEAAIQAIIRRHRPLRTVFAVRQGRVMQRALPVTNFNVQRGELAGAPDSAKELDQIERAAADLAGIGFDLRQGPLLEVVTYALSGGDCFLVFACHHVAMDGLSAAVFLQELSVNYQALLNNSEPKLPTLPVAYKDYCRTQAAVNVPEVLEQRLQYWKEKLGDKLPRLSFLPEGILDDKPACEAGLVETRIPSMLEQKIRDVAQQEHVTPFMILLTAFKVVLHRIFGSEKVIVGTSTAHRPAVEFDSVIGPFTNALPLLSNLRPEMPFREVLQQVRKVCLEAYSQEVPFETLVRHLGLNRSLTDSGRFQALFVFHNYLPAECRLGELSMDLQPFAGKSTDFELLLAVYPQKGDFVASLTFKSRRFAHTAKLITQTYVAALETFLLDMSTRVGALALPNQLEPQPSPARPPSDRIAIVATFTADLFKEPLEFWADQLRLPAEVVMAPYNQLLQELWNPSGLLLNNGSGVNIVLLRIADWLRFNVDRSTSECIEEHGRELVRALEHATNQASVPWIVAIGPSARAEVPPGEEPDFFSKCEKKLISQLQRIARVKTLESEKLRTNSEDDSWYEARLNETAHIPFTRRFTCAASSVIAQALWSLHQPSNKVIVLDCDGVLWEGVAAEDGPLGVRVEARHRFLQEFMVQQHSQGKLLCLCSKNDERDALAVFDANPGMLLKREMLAGWKINWHPKSANLSELAADLGLGLDSFIFVDDDFVECAAIEQHCPEVLVVPLSRDILEWRQFFLSHWAFNSADATHEDRFRTRMYRENAARMQVQSASSGFGEFFRNLQLKVRLSEMRDDEAARVSQLMQRTNQFNSTRKIYEAPMLLDLCQRGSHRCLVAEVSDRFGSYGLVGVLVAARRSTTYEVEVMLLSCRALARGIEHQMLRHLGEQAAREGIERIEIPFMRTSRNQPAFDFLKTIGRLDSNRVPDSPLFVITTPEAVKIEFDVQSATLPRSGSHEAKSPERALHHRGRSLAKIAAELWTPELVEAAIDAKFQRQQESKPRDFTPPKTAVQRILADLWRQVLRIDHVSIHDNFFEVGGHSVLGAILLAKVCDTFEVDPPLYVLFQQPTIAGLAHWIENELIRDLENVSEERDDSQSVVATVRNS